MEEDSVSFDASCCLLNTNILVPPSAAVLLLCVVCWLIILSSVPSSHSRICSAVGMRVGAERDSFMLASESDNGQCNSKYWPVEATCTWNLRREGVGTAEGREEEGERAGRGAIVVGEGGRAADAARGVREGDNE